MHCVDISAVVTCIIVVSATGAFNLTCLLCRLEGRSPAKARWGTSCIMRWIPAWSWAHVLKHRHRNGLVVRLDERTAWCGRCLLLWRIVSFLNRESEMTASSTAFRGFPTVRRDEPTRFWPRSNTVHPCRVCGGDCFLICQWQTECSSLPVHTLAHCRQEPFGFQCLALRPNQQPNHLIWFLSFPQSPNLPDAATSTFGSATELDRIGFIMLWSKQPPTVKSTTSNPPGGSGPLTIGSLASTGWLRISVRLSLSAAAKACVAVTFSESRLIRGAWGSNISLGRSKEAWEERVKTVKRYVGTIRKST